MATQSAAVEVHSAVNSRLATTGPTTTGPTTTVASLPRHASPAVKQHEVKVRSAKNYAGQDAAHAELNMEHSLYAGQNYETIAGYLQRSDDQVKRPPSSEEPFVSLHDLSLAESDPTRVQHFDSILKALRSSNRFRATSVGCRQHDENIDQNEIERLRKRAAAEMRDYITNLKHENNIKMDSIVRSFSVHDQNHFTFEQDISLCVNEFGSGWLATVWLDNGNDLMEGPAGPWPSNFLRSHSWKTSINPTILHRPRIALKTSYIAPQPSRQHRSQGKFPQSASLLHSHYGRLLNTEASIGDPFYALSEIMAFFASSESQFLNMIEQKIVFETERSLSAGELADKEGSHRSTLSNLVYNKKIIDKHIRRLKENITSLARHGDSRWPKATEEK